LPGLNGVNGGGAAATVTPSVIDLYLLIYSLPVHKYYSSIIRHGKKSSGTFYYPPIQMKQCGATADWNKKSWIKIPCPLFAFYLVFSQTVKFTIRCSPNDKYSTFPVSYTIIQYTLCIKNVAHYI